MNTPSSLIKTLLVIAIVALLLGCAPSVQWWRVGDCLVLYENGKDGQRIVVAGQQCDIKREDLLRGQGMARSSWR